MANLNEKIFREALSLPVDQRAWLVDKLLESLSGPIPDELERAWAEEAERRLEEVVSGKVQSIPGEEVFKKIHVWFQK